MSPATLWSDILMKNRKLLSKMTLEQRPPASGRIEVRDNRSPLVFRVSASGARSFCVRARISRGEGNGEQVRVTFPKSAIIENLSEARLWAHNTVDACRAGHDPRIAAMDEAEAIKRKAERAARMRIEVIVPRYVKDRLHGKKKNRTAGDVARILEVYVVPEWRGRGANEITRADIQELLDKVYDRRVVFEGRTYGGPVAADNVLAQVRSLLNWHSRAENYMPPDFRELAKNDPKTLKRDRILTDDEIRALWTATKGKDTYHCVVRALLLSGQRRDEIARMAWSEIDADGVWILPAERSKNKKAHALPLPDDLRKIVKGQPRHPECDLIFTRNGSSAIGDWDKCKKRLDAAILLDLKKAATARGDDPAKVNLPEWRLHDLRRTARTLMSRARVPGEFAERVLNHSQDIIRDTYDLYAYTPEKRQALEALADLIQRIVNPPKDNVVSLHQEQRAAE